MHQAPEASASEQVSNTFTTIEKPESFGFHDNAYLNASQGLNLQSLFAF